VETAARIVGRLAEERARAPLGAPCLLAFDADGTLWDGDVGFDLFEALMATRGAREDALDALEREAEEFEVHAPGDANDVATALFAAYGEHRYPEPRAFAMMAWAFAGYRQDELHEFVAQVLRRNNLEARVHAELAPILAWATAEGVETMVVSASPRAVVVAGVALLGIPPERVLAMTPAIEDGRIAPRLTGPIVYAEGKLDVLRAARPSAALLGAFGDTVYDGPMLRAARVPVAVHAKTSLVEVAATIPGLVALGT
jgi:phosphoserine phosphatase